MDLSSVFKEACHLLPATYLDQGLNSNKALETKFKSLISQRKWPRESWDDHSISLFLNHLSSLDTNNFPTKVGVGEREGRVYSDLVLKRHFRFCHGIGRSGDLTEIQPKAAGSSLLNVLTNCLVLDFCKTIVHPKISDAFLVPFATGMSLAFTFMTLKKLKPKGKYVIWSRIDQKSCFKSIITAGLQPIIIEPVIESEQLVTNLKKVMEAIETYKDEILCVMSTTSCFAPRGPDSLIELSKIAKEHDIFHVVNNAYGLQSGKCNFLIHQAIREGRLDVFLQSTDKNLMVPVGGAIIAGFNSQFLTQIKKNYPGRASSSQSLDVFITLLSMGRDNYEKMMSERKQLHTYTIEKLSSFGEKVGEKVLSTPDNQISIGFTIKNLGKEQNEKDRLKTLTQLGSMLFLRNVTGSRVITCKETKTIEGFEFRGWGASHNEYPVPYFTVAATIGITKEEIDIFLQKLEESYDKLVKNK